MSEPALIDPAPRAGSEPAAARPLIEATGIGVRRDGRWLIRHVDLTIRPREIVTLIGPNGSGKSTTARTALGLIPPDEGTVERAADLTVGYVPQTLAIDWTLPLTVARLMRLTARPSDAAIAAALERVGIAHLAGAHVQHLSGGEFQRALLARAIVRSPDLLVLDEPVQGVDFSGQVAIYDLIRTIRDETGCGILMISHDLHVVMADTDSVLCLNGHVCCRGSPQSVIESPEYLQLFGKRAAETLAIYRHHHDHAHRPDGSVVPRGERPAQADPHHAHDCGHDHE